MELRGYNPADFAVLQELWEARWPQFPLAAALWSQQTEGDPLHYRPDLLHLAWQEGKLQGMLLLKVPPRTPAWSGQNPHLGWVSVLLVRPGLEATLGQQLLTLALESLVSRGVTQVRYGGSPAHFFPGVPLDDPELARLLIHNGFQAGQVDHDYIRSLSDWLLPEGALEPLQRWGVTVEPCTLPYQEGLLAFLDRVFPGRWAYETRIRLGREQDSSEVILARQRDQVIGFAHTYSASSQHLGPALYWRPALGPGLGGLGPIGLDPEARGKGLGLAFLAASVDLLSQRGVEPMVIDWTTLGDFYGKLGFVPWRGYQDYRRGL